MTLDSLDTWRTEAEDFRKAEEVERLRRRQVERGDAHDWEAWYVALDQRIGAAIDRWLELNPLQDALDQAFSDERSERREQITAAIDDAKRPFETKLAALEQRLDWETGDRWNNRIEAAQARLRADLIETVSKGTVDQIRAEVGRELVQACESQRALETRLASLEERLDWETGDRWTDRLEAAQARLRADLIEAVSKGIVDQLRAELSRELVQAHEAQRALETRLANLEERLEQYKARPGKLPTVADWQCETVTYANDLVSHGGALWQATRDTAQKPGGSDWVCIARAGRDAISFRLRGTFNAAVRYRKQDIVEYDGSSYAACRDDPGLPGHGDGWQVVASRGSRGIQGAAGPRGHRGDRGPKAEPPPKIVTWKIDRAHYRVVPLMSDSTFGAPLELYELFAMYQMETS